ncbi:hypothetical protein BLSMQ_3451 [Brevibacterium aurantiacum]|uniref:Uncharacterized protein n=1 Tax=Brevibacterium aurantiacum TaxID=273384 RepID=A0A1D7W819_BREAU|nr:hypothetical protein BLSMQ_3451 [Brevibacterium aurantiacum]
MSSRVIRTAAEVVPRWWDHLGEGVVLSLPAAARRRVPHG